MPIVSAGAVPISALREPTAPHFADWDRSVRLVDARRAKQARRNIQSDAKAAVPKEGDYGGFYFFLQLAPNGESTIRYIGIAERPERPMRARMIDRFRDDSCFDVGLDVMAEEDAAILIDRRLATAMPTTAPATRGRYVQDHLRTSAFVRSIAHAVLIACENEGRQIRQTEAALIGSACAAGAALTNVQSRNFRGPVEPGSARLAQQVLERLTGFGVAANFVGHWRAHLSAYPLAN